MFGILKWECIVHGKELENVKQDRKHSKRIERYEVSENAIYFDGKYLPVSLIKSMRSQPSAYRPHGCCGIGIPVFKIRVEYGAEKPLVLVIEQEEKVEELIDRVLKANPDITLEYYLSPHTGRRIIYFFNNTKSLSVAEVHQRRQGLLFSQRKLFLNANSYRSILYGITLPYDYRNAPLQTWMTCPFTCLPMSEARKRQAFA